MPDTSLQRPFPVRLQGGLVLDKSIFELEPGAAIKLKNFEPDINGGYRRIDGFTTWNSNAISGSGKVLGTFIFGSNVIGCRGANVQYAATGAGAWTSITNARTNAGRYSFDRFNFNGTDKVIMADGTNQAATWDGAAYTLLNATGAPSAPSFVQEYRNHMFYLQGRTLTFSAPYNEADFTPANGAGSYTLPSSGNGLIAHHDELIIFSQDRIWRLVGTSREDFRLDPITKKMGTLSGYSVQEIGGDVVFLGSDGLRLLSSTRNRQNEELGTISKNVQSRFLDQVRDNIVSSIIRSKTQYRMYFPTSDGQLEAQTEGVISVLKATGWEFADLQGIKPNCSDSYYIGDDEIIVHGGYDGKVYQQETTNAFNGTIIPFVYQSPHITMGDAGIRKEMQRVLLNLKAEGSSPFYLNMIYDFEDTNTPQPTAYSITTTSTATYGSGVYATALYGGTEAPLLRQPVEGSGFSVGVKISNTNDTCAAFSIKGFQLDFVPGGRR